MDTNLWRPILDRKPRPTTGQNQIESIILIISPLFHRILNLIKIIRYNLDNRYCPCLGMLRGSKYLRQGWTGPVALRVDRGGVRDDQNRWAEELCRHDAYNIYEY